MNYKILDCTLRDGGYYTNWNFSSSLVEKYLSVMSKLPVDEVEIGYISSNESDNKGLFYHLNKQYLRKIKKSLKKGQKVCCMINAKEIKNYNQLITLLEKNHHYLDVVRFAIDPKQLNFFFKIIKKAKKKFKKISFRINLMYLSKWYKDLHFANKLLNKIDSNIVEEIALVDSYGSLKPLETYNFFKKIISFHKDKKIGCHFHNNCGLALANTLSALDAGCYTADSTLKGMGRGAGNAETELLLSLKKTEKINISSYDFDDLLEEFEILKSKMKWGSSFSYSCSAIKGFSQSEMMDLIQKRRLDTSVALAAISSKLKKNKQKIKFENKTSLSFLKKNTPILIGGADSFQNEGEFFLKNLNNKMPIILSGSNAFKNFKKLKIKISNKIVLILSGSEIKKIHEIKNKNFMKKYNISHLIIERDFLSNEIKRINKKHIILSESVALNPLHLVGKLLIQLKVKKLYLAFFDGDFNSEKGKIVMKETEESLKFIKNNLKVESLTKTFLKLPIINIWNNDKLLHTN